MLTPAQVAEFRAANAKIAGLIEADLDRFWRYVDLSVPSRGQAALLNYVPLLTQRYGEIAATIAADWYEELRADAVQSGIAQAIGRATTFTAVKADPVAVEVSRRAVESAAVFLRTDSPVRALVAIKATSTRHVLQAGRDTITQNAGRDRTAHGWQRFVRPGGCKFCRMLSSRGGVYTQGSSRFAAHDHCSCVSAPTWDKSAPRVDVAAQFVASRKTSAMSDKQRERFRAQVRAYMDRMPPEAGDVYVDPDGGIA